MQAPLYLSVASLLLLLAGIGATFRQGNEARALRAELDALAGALAVADPVTDAAPAAPSAEPLTEAERLELLRLRNQVTRLRGESQGLEAALQENVSLTERLAAAKANPASAGVVLPPGYILRRTARNAGQATPEATVETFLWALEHRELPTLLQTLSPDAAQKLAEMITRSEQQGDDFWRDASKLPGMRVSDQKPMPDGAVELKLSMDIEGTADQQTTKARLLDGRWRLDLR
jgi:hypothetical protein